MTYSLSIGNKIGKDDLSEGKTVCLADVATNPNNIGVLHKLANDATHDFWVATINNITYRFDNTAECLDDNNIVLYELVLPADLTLDISQSSAVTRGAGESAVTTTLSSLIPKDQFAICALEALIGTMPNAVAMDDATILMLAIKSYKISQAMLYIGTLARTADEKASQSSGASSGTVTVDANSLSNNTEKLLNNIYKTLEATKSAEKTINIKTVNPTLKIDNPTNDKFEIEGGGGDSGISYNDIPMLTETGSSTMTHVLGFATDSESNKYVGKLTLATFCNKVWDTVKSKIWNYIKSDVDSEITSQGSTNLASGGSWRSTIESIADARITAKVKSDSLK